MLHEVILIGSAGVGAGDAQLGGLILANFLRLLGERDEMPEYIILWNEGVRIALEGSTWLAHLKTLERRGVKIISCRTCIEFFGLEGQTAAGEVGNMKQIQDILFAKRVLTL